MKILIGPSIPYARSLPAVPPAAPVPAKTVPRVLGGPGLPPAWQAGKVHMLSAAVAPAGPSQDKILDGLRAFSDLVTPSIGGRTAIAINTLWLAADTFTAVQTIRDPNSTKTEGWIEAGNVAADVTALFGGILNAPHLNQASTVLNFAAVVGDHLHTGQLHFTPGEVAQFSTAPDADDVSNLLKITEAMQPDSEA